MKKITLIVLTLFFCFQVQAQNTWTSRTSAADNLWYGVSYGNGLFVAVAGSGTGNRVMTSPDGINWTARASVEDTDWYGVTYGNGLFVAIAFSGTNRVMTSPDGITWTPRTAAAANEWRSITYGNGLFVAVASSGTNRVMTSPNGITWTAQTSAENNNWGGVVYGNGVFVAVSFDGTNRVMTSPDGITWTPRAAAVANAWYGITYGKGLFVATAIEVGSFTSGSGNRVMTSPDGITWTSRTSAADNVWYTVTYGNGLFVALSDDGTNRVMTSPDGITWTAESAAVNNAWYGITYGNGLFVAVAGSGTGNRVMTANAAVSRLTIDAIADQTYTGSPLTPALVVKDDEVTLTLGTHYSVAYTNNTNVGTATATITGMGNYVGTKTQTFAIVAKAASGLTIDDIANQTYTGLALTPVLVVKDGATTLTLDTDYTVAYTDNTDLGTATVTITGMGNYTGTQTFYFLVVEWASRTSAADNDWTSVTYGNGLFVAIAATGVGNRVMTSPDGTTWTARTTPAGGDWYAVTYGDGLFVAVAGNGPGDRVMTSADGITWTLRTAAANNSWRSVTNGNGLFVAVASSGTGDRVMTSPDGITWTSQASAADNSWSSVVYGNGLFVAVATSGSGSRVMSSSDGIAWTVRTSAVDSDWTSVTYGNGVFVAVAGAGTGSRVMSSSDGIAWTARTAPANNNWTSVTYGNGLFVAVASTGEGDRVMSSSDGLAWVLQTYPLDNDWKSLTYYNGLFVAVASSGAGNRVMTLNAAVSRLTVDAIADQAYTGAALTPGVTVEDDEVTLTLDTHYSTEYFENTNLGTAIVVITGLGSYRGATSQIFAIVPKAASGLTIDAIANQTYTGAALTPAIVVKDGSTTLTLGTHYSVAFTNNTNAGTATATITGMGSYAGTKTANFSIAIPPPTITSFSPASGPVGSLVTITGTNLGTPAAFTIGGTAAIVISNTGTSLVGMVMPGAATGTLSLTTAGGSVTSTATFTLSPAPAPNTQQGAKLVGTGNTGAANQGYIVSISADGNTAIVGGDADNSSQGAAWIYTRSGATWSQQGAKLVGTGAVGNAQQGIAVSLSADGTTAIVGGYADDSFQGAAWIFTRSGTTWSQQGAKLVGTGNTGAARQGRAVSISADGNTAIVSGNFDDSGAGAAWIFTRSGSTWTQQGAKLVGTGAVGNAQQGRAVSLSADGNTAIVGGNRDNSDQGAAWIFTRSGATWTQQGAKLVGTGAVGAARQGTAVSLSADGTTAILGGITDDSSQGAVWVFTRSGATWTQQGAKLVGTGNTGAAEQGFAVSLSADGTTAILGGNLDNTNQGAAWVFTRNGTTWSQRGDKLVGTGNTGAAGQGAAVSISADGTTAIVGGSADNSIQGAAWVYTYVPPPPTITTTGTLAALTTVYATASSNTSFSVSGASLTNDIIVAAPSGFEVSVSPTSGFSTTVTLTQTSGTVSNTTIYVRLKSNSTVAGSPYSGDVTCTSTNAQTVNVATVSSTVTALGLTVTGVTANNKEYDASLTATLGGTATLVGVVTADQANVTLAGTATATFNNASVETNKAVTVTGYTLGGTAAGNYTVSQPTGLTANITAKAASTLTIDAIANQNFTGAAITPTVVVKDGSTTLTATTDYSIAYSNNTNVGTATVTITGAGNYTGTKTQTFTIVAKAASTLTIDAIANQTYTGAALTPVVIVKDGNTTLTATTDYTVAYTNNTNVGTATVTITGAGNYTGTKTQTFTIVAKAASTLTIDAIANQTYTGAALTPVVIVKDGNTTLTATTDYTIAYTNNTNVGTATVTITGAGNYTGTKTQTFTIVAKAASTLTIDAIANQTYTGLALTPAVVVKDGSTTLTVTTDYTVAYSNNTNVGTATVTITGVGNYSGTKTQTFTIVTKAASTLSIDAIANQTYTGLALTPAVVVKDGNTTLTATTDYTVAYSNNTNVGMATVTLRGLGNYTGTKTQTFAIVSKAVSGLTIESIPSQNYTGAAITPAVVVKDGATVLTLSIDYTVAYSNNTNVGTASVTITGVGTYAGSKTQPFAIVSKAVSGLTIESIPSQNYTGAAITPAVVVKDGATVLTLSTDYTIAYTNNTNVGTAKVTMTGAGNYSGSKTQTFAIISMAVSSLTIDPIADQIFTGSALTPVVVVKEGSTTLTLGIDYSVAYFNNTNVGTATVTITGVGTYTGTKTQTFAIAPKAVTIKANNASKIYGDANPSLSFTYSGLVDGDTEIDQAPSISTSATITSGVGSYRVLLSEGSDPNYRFTLQEGVLEVSPAPLSLSVNAATKSYGQADPDYTYRVQGLKGADTKTVIRGALSRAGGEDPGSYRIAAGTISAGANYTLLVSDANLLIVKARVFSVDELALVTTEWSKEAVLPITANVLTTHGQYFRVEVKWDKSSLNVFARGTYSLTGTLMLPLGIENPDQVFAKVQVQVLPKPAPLDLTLTNNSFAGSTSTFFISVGDVVVNDPVDEIHVVSLNGLGYDNRYFEIIENILYWSSAEPAAGKTTFNIVVRVTDRDGNTLDKLFEISRLRPAFSSVTIYNTFTPNGDRFNDTWGAAEVRFYEGTRISVYERGGARVFYTENPDIRWNGTSAGKEMPIGTYFWVIQIGETGETRRGMVNVIRK